MILILLKRLIPIHGHVCLAIDFQKVDCDKCQFTESDNETIKGGRKYKINLI